MSASWAATLAVIGVVALAWAVLIWRKLKQNKSSRWVPMLTVASGLCLGVAIGGLANLSIVSYKIGLIQLWVPFVLIVGFGFFLEMKGWNDHPTRTPILGFVTALVLMLAVGHAVVKFSAHTIRTVQTTSNVVPSGTHGKH